jgi:hypothetical protein
MDIGPDGFWHFLMIATVESNGVKADAKFHMMFRQDQQGRGYALRVQPDGREFLVRPNDNADFEPVTEELSDIIADIFENGFQRFLSQSEAVVAPRPIGFTPLPEADRPKPF